MLPPNHADPIIGRDADIYNAKDCLTKTRLLTLKGTAGVGKTRLAIQLFYEFQPVYGENIYFVSLTTVRDPQLVIFTIAHALQLAETTSSDSSLARVKEYLNNQEALLILDNFEHLLTSAAPLATLRELLNSCPKLKIIITSRELLKIREESWLEIQPLPTPNRIDLDFAKSLIQNPAITLFLQFQRRNQQLPEYAELDKDKLKLIAQICQKLDGLPLALELAAVRVRAFGLQTILEKLNNPLEFLGYGNRDLPEHQQTLRSAIEWSFNLLDSDGQRLFRRLGVFVDGFTLQAVEKVCSLTQTEAETNLAVIDIIQNLVDCSLLQVRERNNTTRFRMLETIREFALKNLSVAGEESDLRVKHALYYQNLALELKKENSRAKATAIIEAEEGNFNNALQWTHKNNLELFLHLCNALWIFWNRRNQAEIGRFWFDLLLKYLEDGQQNQEQVLLQQVPAEIKAQAFNGAGIIALANKLYTEADNYLEKSQKLWQQVLLEVEQIGSLELEQIKNKKTECERGLSDVLSNRGIIAANLHDHHRSKEFFQNSLEIRERIGYLLGVAIACNNIGLAFIGLKQYETAEQNFQKALKTYDILENIEGVATCQLNLSQVYHNLGDYIKALDILTKSYSTFITANNKQRISNCIGEFAAIALKQGNYFTSALLFGLDKHFRQENKLQLPATDEKRYSDYDRQLQEKLGKTKFEQVLLEGGKLQIEQLLDFIGKELYDNNKRYPDGLTKTEVDVLRELARGLKNEEISKKLGYSNSRVNNVLTDIYSKIGIESEQSNKRVEAIKYAQRNNIC